jgi:hypothetical protein
MKSNTSEKLLGLSVHRFALGECTNGGISSKVHTVYIPCAEGPTSIEDVDPLTVFDVEQRGPNYFALKPRETLAQGRWSMAGGNLAHTSDSRGKGFIYHIHDRFES